MSLVEHATRELELSGQTAEDPGYAASLVAAVAAFASYGHSGGSHSGGSHSVAIQQLHTLLQYRTLSPLTTDPDEWMDRSEVSSTPLWQNRRDSAAFSHDGGRSWYFADGRIEDHPEATCRRCGGPNLCWSAPSPLWNQVMRGGSINGDDLYDGIVCPMCFAQLAGQHRVADAWWFTAKEVHVELETVTPSGRVWNEIRQLWDDAAPEGGSSGATRSPARYGGSAHRNGIWPKPRRS